MIYFDNAATTKPSNSALEKAAVFNQDKFYNPSTLYSGGLNSAREIKITKESILKNLGATNHEVIFTSCGSESDNLAIFCSVKRGLFVTSQGEHSAVYKSFLELKNRGLTIEFIPLNKDGSVNTEVLYEFLSKNDVAFLSVVHVNNETGAINDVNDIAKKVKSINRKTIVHVDGVQAYGKLPYILSSDIDFYAISAHKINGLKGVGALLKRKGVNLTPLIFGGGQENGLRSGTENLFGIKVFEYAGLEKYLKLKDNYQKVCEIKEFIQNSLNKEVFTVISGENSSPYILTLSAGKIKGEVIMHSLESEGLIIGNGSACSSRNRHSRVIEACGYKNDILDGVIRLSFSNENTLDEARLAVEMLNKVTNKLKGIIK